MKTRLTLIAAVSGDGFISRGTGVPWDLPLDRKHFRTYTLGRWLLIGRKTYQEMQGWFQPCHQPLVLTRDADFMANPGRTVQTIEQAIHLTKEAGATELVCCGGGLVYASAIPLADRLIVTHVDHQLHEGVPFPIIQSSIWRPTHRQRHLADQNHKHGFEIVHYERNQA